MLLSVTTISFHAQLSHAVACKVLVTSIAFVAVFIANKLAQAAAYAVFLIVFFIIKIL